MLTSFNSRGSVLAVGAVTERVRASQPIQRRRQLDLPRCLRRGGRRARPIRRRRSRRWPTTPPTTCGRPSSSSTPCWAIPAVPISLHRADSGDLINVALMVERAAPQSQLDALLGGDWADRASYIASQGNGIWSTFGADPAVYANTQQAILAALDNPATNPMTLAARAGLQRQRRQPHDLAAAHGPSSSTRCSIPCCWRTTRPTPGPARSACPRPSRSTRSPASGSTRGVLFNNPVHAASVPANPTTPAPARCRSGNWAASTTTWMGARHRPRAGRRHRHAGRGRRLLQFPAGDRRRRPRRSRCWKPGLHQPNLLAALNAYRQDLGLRPLSPTEFQSIGRHHRRRRAATSSSSRSTSRSSRAWRPTARSTSTAPPRGTPRSPTSRPTRTRSSTACAIPRSCPRRGPTSSR